VVYLDPREFRSTWLGNKAVYRTRMAIADGGELIVLAPGVVHLGEDAENDRLIRKYGYVGRENVLKLVNDPANTDLKANLSVAAHLIHGSSDGRFSITYCTEKLTREEVEGVSFAYAPYAEMAAKYDPSDLIDGWNTVGGEEIYYISNPALGLWVYDKE
ncbi:MAG: D-mannonate epimerase, partial [Eubacteriales bacterium]